MTLNTALKILDTEGRSLEDFCLFAALRYETLMFDADVLANRARVAVWHMISEGTELTGEAFVKVARTRISHNLADTVRYAQRHNRDCRQLVDLAYNHHESVDPFDAADFSSSVAKLSSRLTEDGNRLLDVLMNGSDSLDEILFETFERIPAFPGRRPVAAALGWTVVKYRNEIEKVRFAAAEVFAV